MRRAASAASPARRRARRSPLTNADRPAEAHDSSRTPPGRRAASSARDLDARILRSRCRRHRARTGERADALRGRLRAARVRSDRALCSSRRRTCSSAMTFDRRRRWRVGPPVPVRARDCRRTSRESIAALRGRGAGALAYLHRRRRAGAAGSVRLDARRPDAGATELERRRPSTTPIASSPDGRGGVALMVETTGTSGSSTSSRRDLETRVTTRPGHEDWPVVEHPTGECARVRLQPRRTWSLYSRAADGLGEIRAAGRRPHGSEVAQLVVPRRRHCCSSLQFDSATPTSTSGPSRSVNPEPPAPFLQTPYRERDAALLAGWPSGWRTAPTSPDAFEVYVTSYPDRDIQEERLSRDGGVEP